MTSREQFEAWLRAQPHVLNVGIEPDGTYTLHEDRVAWMAWQASRNALEIKLPPAINTEEIGVAISKERTMARLAFAGINVIEGEKKNG